MEKTITIESPEDVSIEYSFPFQIPLVNAVVSRDTSISLSLPQELTVLLIAPDEYNYRPPDVANEPPTFTVNNLEVGLMNRRVSRYNSVN